MNIKSFASVGLCFGLICCAVAPAPRQIQNSFPIDKPFDAVWQSVIETFGELNLPIMNMEKASGLITTDWISFQGQKDEIGYCSCGEAGFPFVEQDRSGRFNVYVKKISDTASEIKVNAIFEQFSKDIWSRFGTTTKRHCVSTGKLEAEIYKRVSEKIK